MGSAERHPGDSGESTLLDGRRLPKDDPVFEALGGVDELVAALGVARAELDRAERRAEAAALRAIQRVLLKIGSEIALSPESPRLGKIEPTTEEDVASLSALEGELSGGARRPEGFVLPGATPAEAALHVARASCRKAERRLVSCARRGASHLALAERYLNRLSGYLYALAICFGTDT